MKKTVDFVIFSFSILLMSSCSDEHMRHHLEMDTKVAASEVKSLIFSKINDSKTDEFLLNYDDIREMDAKAKSCGAVICFQSLGLSINKNHQQGIVLSSSDLKIQVVIDRGSRKSIAEIWPHSKIDIMELVSR